MQLTDHYSLEQLTTNGRHPEIPNVLPAAWLDRAKRVAMKLEQAREILGVELRTSYGYRCEALNKACGGSPTSDHMNMLAADFNPLGLSRVDAFRKLWSDPHFMEGVDQLIFERGCLHVGLGARIRHQGRGDMPHYPLLAVWPEPLPDVLVT